MTRQLKFFLYRSGDSLLDIENEVNAFLCGLKTDKVEMHLIPLELEGDVVLMIIFEYEF